MRGAETWGRPTEPLASFSHARVLTGCVDSGYRAMAPRALLPAHQGLRRHYRKGSRLGSATKRLAGRHRRTPAARATRRSSRQRLGTRRCACRVAASRPLPSRRGPVPGSGERGQPSWVSHRAAADWGSSVLRSGVWGTRVSLATRAHGAHDNAHARGAARGVAQLCTFIVHVQHI